MDTIYELVRKAEQDDLAGGTNISKYVTFSLRDNIEKIDAYLNSKHISGDTDSMNREKPFFNIVTASVNIWYRATDIDRKNIKIKAAKAQQTVLSFLATAILHDWMKRSNFGSFLNDWGRSLARYGSTVLKFVEKEGELYADVIPWNRIIIDPIDFENNIKIEILELTAAQLRKRKGYDKKQVESLIESETARQTIGGQNKDNKAGYIKLYEVHGELPLSFVTGKEKDEDTYTQQMHVISFVEGKEKGTFDDFTLISGREDKDPYMITHLIREDGRSQAIGAVEHLFEAQWMMNHTVKSIKDQLDLASKLIFQTSDGNFVGQNALSNIETGDILIHANNAPLTQIANTSHDISSLQAFGNQWKSLSQEITSTPDALMGSNAPSGTAWRQVEALQQEAHSLFEQMTENKGIHIEEMMRRYVLPFVKTKLDTTDEVSAVLGSYGIDKLEEMYIKNESVKRNNEINIDSILNDTPATTPEEQAMNIKNELQSQGTNRFFKPSEISSYTWKELFKDFEWEAEVDVTSEDSYSKDDITTLTTVFQTIADPMKQAVLQTPQGKFLFNQILEKTGTVSPIQLQELASAPAPQMQPQMPTPALAGGGQPTGGAGLPVNK
jgi:hypothetical protein